MIRNIPEKWDLEADIVSLGSGWRRPVSGDHGP